MPRVRRAPDPQRVRTRPQSSSPDPARRSTTTPTAPSRGKPLLPGRLALRRASREEPTSKRLRDLAIERKPILPIESRSSSKAMLKPSSFRNPLAPPLARIELLAEDSPRSSQAWLGDPVAIKDATAVALPPPGRKSPPDHRPEGRGGTRDHGRDPHRPVRPVPSGEIRAPSAKAPGSSIIDGTPEDDAHANYLDKVAAASCRVITSRSSAGSDAPRVVARGRRGGLTPSATRRRRRTRDLPPDPRPGPVPRLPPQGERLRLRQPRRGRSRPADHLAAILKEGSALGVHLVTWSDTLSQPQPRLRQPRRSASSSRRVLFQVSPTDSAHLLDSPAASKLGPNRALFASEEQNRLEKFRPYGLPSDERLAAIRERFAARGEA